MNTYFIFSTRALILIFFFLYVSIIIITIYQEGDKLKTFKLLSRTILFMLFAFVSYSNYLTPHAF